MFKCYYKNINKIEFIKRKRFFKMINMLGKKIEDKRDYAKAIKTEADERMSKFGSENQI